MLLILENVLQNLPFLDVCVKGLDQCLTIYFLKKNKSRKNIAGRSTKENCLK